MSEFNSLTPRRLGSTGSVARPETLPALAISLVQALGVGLVLAVLLLVAGQAAPTSAVTGSITAAVTFVLVAISGLRQAHRDV